MQTDSENIRSHQCIGAESFGVPTPPPPSSGSGGGPNEMESYLRLSDNLELWNRHFPHVAGYFYSPWRVASLTPWETKWPTWISILWIDRRWRQIIIRVHSCIVAYIITAITLDRNKISTSVAYNDQHLRSCYNSNTIQLHAIYLKF